MAQRIDGISLGMIAAGSLFLYAAVKGKSIVASVQTIIKGQSPAGVLNTEPITGAPVTQQPGTAPTQGYAMVTNIPAAQGSYSQQGLEQLWTNNGGPSDTAAFAAAVAWAESTGNPKAQSSNPDGGTNAGLWQLDTNGVGSGYSVAELEDPNLNCQVTIMATNGGVNWTEWGDPITAAVGYHYTPGSPVP